MKDHGHRARLYFLSAIFLVMLLVLIWRVLDLTILNRQFLKGQGDARSLRTLNLPAYRGMITDREGAPLAVSTPVQSVWINPKDFKPTKKQLANLSQLLGISTKELHDK